MDKIEAFLKGIFTSKQFKYGSNTFIMTAAVIGILLLVNIFISSQPWKLDLTVDQKFSVSKETKDYLKTVKKDVRIIAFYDLGKEPQDVKNTLEDYKKYCPKLAVEYVDPDQNPGAAQKYNKDGSGLSSGTIVVESGSKFRKLKEYDLYDVDYQTGRMKASKVEQKLTGAISYVVGEKDPVIYLLGGHSEMGLGKSKVVKTALEDVNYIIKDLNLISVDSVPRDADIIAIVAPKKDISMEEKVKLEKYLDGGGRLMVFLDPYVDLPNLSNTLKKYNIGIDNDIVIETDSSSVVFNYPLYLKPQIQNSDITSAIASKNLNIIFPGARSLSVVKNDKLGLKVQSLAKTSPDSWGEVDKQEQTPQKDANDISGPLDLALAAERDPMTAEATQRTRVVVFGNSAFLTDEAFDKLGAVGNYDLFVNTLSWLGERKDNVVVSSKFITTDKLRIQSVSQVVFILILVSLLPIAAIIAGTVIWLRRRHL